MRIFRHLCISVLVLVLGFHGWFPVYADSLVPSQGHNISVHPSDSAKKPIKIGFITSLTGICASDGPLMVKGIKFYLDQIGYQMSGRKVELKVEDDSGDIVKAFAKAHKLVVDDKVDVLCGVIFSPFVYAVTTVADQFKVPFVVSTSTADDLTQRKCKKWVLRICSTSSQLSQPMGEYAVTHLHLKKVVTIGCNYMHCWEVVGGFQKSFEDNGGQVIQKIWVPTDVTDFTKELKTIDQQCDAIFLALVGTPSRYLPAQLHKLYPHIPVIASTATFEDNILQQIGPYVLGGISSASHSSTVNDKFSRDFVKAYHAKYGEDPSIYAERSYLAGFWINNAVDKLHGDVSDKGKFLAALKDVDLKDSIGGPLRLDRYGSIVQNIYIRKVEKINGKYVNSVIFTYPMVSQFFRSEPEDFLKHPVFSKTYPPCTHCLSAQADRKLGNDPRLPHT